MVVTCLFRTATKQRTCALSDTLSARVLLCKVTADDAGGSFSVECQLLRRRAIHCQPTITFAIWQRALPVVQSLEVNAVRFVGDRCRKNLPLVGLSFVAHD